MPYDCVISTKNRIAALRMSIPLVLKQDLRPERLIVVDASDDHESVRTELNVIGDQFGFRDITVVKADCANSARQRNTGLQLVTAPVVMFPDDDSLWYEGFASSVMKIYDADSRGQVGGVSGAPVPAPPSEVERPAYRKGAFAGFKEAVTPYRNYIEQRSFPRPFDLIAASTWTETIDVVDGVHSKRLPHITGFRMSFRTSAIRGDPFDETLGYAAGYAYHEDIDVCLRMERRGLALVSAEDAKVCHYSFPGPRGNGYVYGFCAIANCVYVCKKTIGNNKRLYRVLERYLLYKLSLYASRFHSAHNRELFHGAFDAWRNRSKLMAANESALADAYKALCDQYIKKSRKSADASPRRTV